MTKTKALTERIRAIDLLRSFDLRLALIIALITVSTGHVGRLFADREHDQQAFIGYVLAVAIDGVLAVSLHEVGALVSGNTEYLHCSCLRLRARLVAGSTMLIIVRTIPVILSG